MAILRAARKLAKAHSDAPGRHRHEVEHLIEEALLVAAAEGQDATNHAVEMARSVAADHPRWLRRLTAWSQARHGDITAARKSLGLDADVDPASPLERMILARAYAAAEDIHAAVSMLRPIVERIDGPDDLVFSAELGILGGDAEITKLALRRLAGLDGAAAKVASVASQLLDANDPSARALALRQATAEFGGRTRGSAAGQWKAWRPRPIRPLSPPTTGALATN